MYQGVVSSQTVAKGREGTITVTFEATEMGFFDKQILVRTNAAEKMVFRVTGNVKK